MNIPARYCTGYLGDIGVPVDPAPMDFSAWFEAYLDGRWYTFDARHKPSPDWPHRHGARAGCRRRRDLHDVRRRSIGEIHRHYGEVVSAPGRFPRPPDPKITFV